MIVRLLVLLLLLGLPGVAGATGPQRALDMSGGGGGGGAPTGATYVTQTHDATLSAEQALADLATGLVVNTTGTGVLSAYAGTSCSNKFPRSLDASGAATCASVSLTADVTGVLPDANVADAITVSGGTITNSSIKLFQGVGPTPTIEGDLQWDTSADVLVIGASGATAYAAKGDSTGKALTGDSATAFFGAGQLEVARGGTNADLSATGGTSQVLKQTSVGGNITVGQLAFTDISGSVTDAQVPDTITLTNITQIGTRPHSSLTGLSSDDHTIYALLAGRSGGQTLIGGTASGDDLTLQSTSNGTKGTLFLDDTIELWPNIPDITTGGTTKVLSFSADMDLSGAAAFFEGFQFAPTIHIGQASSLFATGSVVSTQGMSILHDDATAITSQLPFFQLFWAGHTILTTVAVGPPSQYTLLDQTGFLASGAITVPSGSGVYNTIRSTPSIKAIAGATFTYPEVGGFLFAPTVGTDNGASDGTAVTVTSMYGAKFNDVVFDAGAGSKTVGTYVAVDIAALSNATTSIGFRNADVSVYTPPTTVTVGAAFTLTATATTQKIDATAARTSNTTTAITDGVADGQEFIVMNVDASGDAITIKNAANTDLGADCVLNQGGTLRVVWSSDRSDWLSMGCSAN